MSDILERFVRVLLPAFLFQQRFQCPLSIGQAPRQAAAHPTQQVSTAENPFRDTTAQQLLCKCIREVIAVAIEHVITAACVLFRQFADYLSETVAHHRCFPKVELAVERKFGCFGLDSYDSGFLWVGGDHAETIFPFAECWDSVLDLDACVIAAYAQHPQARVAGGEVIDVKVHLKRLHRNYNKGSGIILEQLNKRFRRRRLTFKDRNSMALKSSKEGVLMV